MERKAMRLLQMKLKGVMILIAAIAIALGLARWSLALSLLFLEAVVAYPIYATEPEDWSSSAKVAYAVGIFGPTLCLIFDPVVFQGGDEHGPILDGCRTFAYAFIGLEMAVFALWLSAGLALARVSGLLSGALGTGAVFAACIGVLILPFTLLGLLVGIGVLGIVPFLVALSFFSQSKAAADLGRAAQPRWQLRIMQAVGAALAVGLPVLMHLTCDLPPLFIWGVGNLDDALSGKFR
jgi:hypothetical protein